MRSALLFSSGRHGTCRMVGGASVSGGVPRCSARRFQIGGGPKTELRPIKAPRAQTQEEKALPWWGLGPHVFSGEHLTGTLKRKIGLSLAGGVKVHEFNMQSFIGFHQLRRALFGGDSPFPKELVGEHPPALEAMLESTLARELKRRIQQLHDLGQEVSASGVGVMYWCPWSDFVVAPDRRAPQPTGRWQRYPRNFRWITYVAHAEEEEGTGGYFHRPKLADVSRLCFQIAVDCICFEKVQVKDRATGNVLRGPSEELGVRHRVVYEADLGVKVTPDYKWIREKLVSGDDGPHEWKVVDVDDMFGGHGHPYCTPPPTEDSDATNNG